MDKSRKRLSGAQYRKEAKIKRDGQREDACAMKKWLQGSVGPCRSTNNCAGDSIIIDNGGGEDNNDVAINADAGCSNDEVILL